MQARRKKKKQLGRGLAHVDSEARRIRRTWEAGGKKRIAAWGRHRHRPQAQGEVRHRNFGAQWR